MTIKAVLPRNGSIYFTNFSAKLSSIDNGGYTPNADDLKRQILNQKTKIEQNSQQISLKASSTELSDVRTIANGAVSSADSANNKINGITSNGGGRNLLRYSTNDNGKFQPNLSRIDNYIIYAASTVYMTQGQQYTVHADASSGLVWSGTHNPNVTSNNVVLWLTDGINVSQIISDANTGTRTTFTWNHPSGTYYLRVNTYKSDNSGYAEKVMLEKGAIAHDWTPSPEDVDANTDAKIDNLQIGDINLLKDTDKMTNTNYWGLRGGQSIRATYGGKYANETGVALSDDNVQFNTPTSFIDYIPQITFEQGTDYTVSFWTTVVSTPLLYLNADDGDNHQHWGSSQTISLQASGREYSMWKQVTATFKPTVATAYLTFGVSTDVNNKVSQYWASSFKLEKGNKATDWQPAPEDIQTQIDQVRTDIQSTLTVANNGITAATNLKTTYDNYVQKNDANIKLLGDRITNEVSKITSNGGGVNLLTGSKTMHDGWSTEGASVFKADGYLVVKATDSNMRIYQNPSEDTNGKLMSVSFDAEVTADSKNQSVQIQVGPFQAGVDVTISGDAFKRYKVENWKWNSAYKAFSIHFKNANDKINIKNIKLEFGAVATPWTPAPEDTDSAIEAVSSKIDQTATSITSTVNSTKQDLQGQINSANTKITQTADSITEQLKSYSKTGDIQNYVNTTVQKTADGINTKVSGVESKVNGLNTSDRNLARGTSDSWADYVFVTDGGNNRTISLSKVYIDGLKAGDVLTCGITIKNTGITAGTMRVQGSGNATGWNDGSYYSPNYDIASAIPSGTTKELVYTITLTANMIKNSFWDVNIRTDNVPKGGTLSYKCFFVKKGNIPTGWSPAPEDVDSAIATTKTDLVQQITDAKNAAIKVSKDSINSEVSDVRTTITQVNNKVSGVESKVDNANSKINDITSNGGGRNLLIISSFVGDSKTFAPTFDAHWKCGNNTTWTFSSDKPVSSNDQSLQFTPKSSLPNTGNGIWYIAPQVKAGEVYTFSFWGKSTSDGFKMEVESFSDISKFTMTTAWKYYSGQLKFASDNRNMYFRISDDNSVNVGTVTIFHPMLEKGTVAHEWQPAPEDVATDISNVDTKVEQYKTGINQTATGMNLFAQVITGNKDIDVTKSNIGIDPNQIKIASNRIVIDGDTSINGILNVPNVVLKGKNGSIDLSGDAINIKNSNSTYGLTLASDGVAVGDKDRFYGLFTSSGIDLFTKSQDAPRPFSIGAIENDWLTTNHDIHGISIIGKPYKDNKDNNFQGGNFISFGFQDPETTNNNPMISLFWRDFNVTNDDKEEKGIHMYDDIYINHDIHLYKSPICVRTLGTQDPLMITGLKFGNSTQSDYFQPTLMAGWSNDIKGDSGLTFFWNSIRAFGTLDLTGTQIRMADAEANLEFGWVSWTDWPGKIPALFRRNGNNSGGIAVGGDCNVILFGNGHRWNLNQRNGY